MSLLLDPNTCNANLAKTIKRIDFLKYREEIELLPTKYARTTAVELMMATARHAPNYFFAPWLSGDELGGVRVVWLRSQINAQVRLIVPPSAAQRICIYQEIDDKYSLDFAVSGKILAQYLEWICSENYQKQGKSGGIIVAKAV